MFYKKRIQRLEESLDQVTRELNYLTKKNHMLSEMVIFKSNFKDVKKGDKVKYVRRYRNSEVERTGTYQGHMTCWEKDGGGYFVLIKEGCVTSEIPHRKVYIDKK